MNQKITRIIAQISRMAGASLVTAIFLLVVLATLGAAMLNIFTSQQSSSAMDVQGARAYQAARAGIEWGLYQKLRQEHCGATSSFALPADSSLNGLTVSVTCTLTSTPAAGLGASPAGPLNSTLTAGSADVVINTAGLAPGMIVLGNSIVPGTQILSIVDINKLILTVAASVTGTLSLTYRSPLDRWSISSTACTQPTAAGICPNPAPTSQDYMQRVVQVQF